MANPPSAAELSLFISRVSKGRIRTGDGRLLASYLGLDWDDPCQERLCARALQGSVDVAMAIWQAACPDQPIPAKCLRAPKPALALCVHALKARIRGSDEDGDGEAALPGEETPGLASD